MMKRYPTRNLRRQRQPCFVLGSLLVSSKVCDGFCASRALRRVRGADPRANAITPIPRSTASQFATASVVTPTLVQGRRLYESIDGQGGDSEINLFEKTKSSDLLGANENTLPNTTSNSISLIERIRILSYRTALSVSSLLITALAICSGDVLSGTGVDGSSVVGWVESVMPLTAGMTILLAPVSNNFFSRVISNSLGIVTIASAIASIVFGAGSNFEDNQRVLVSLCLAGICIREIFYFGLAYKVEAAVALVALPFTLVMTSDRQAAEISLPVCALAMDVLAAGKIFEPCIEDFERSNSEFLAGGK